MSGVGAALTAIAAGAPAAMAFLSPAHKKPTKKNWIKVVDDVSTLDVGRPIKVDFVEASNDAWVESRALRAVWLYTEDGEKFIAYSGVCTHLGCSFTFDAEPDKYHSRKDVYHCPCHHGIFDMKTGAVLGGPPPRPLDTLPVRVIDGEVQVLYQTFRTGIPEKVET
jgi:Rieske Fe-S protein